MKRSVNFKLVLVLGFLVTITTIVPLLLQPSFLVNAKEKTSITEFSVPTQNIYLQDITGGPDGNVWFTESTGNKIGRITPMGIITEFILPVDFSNPYGIALGHDGNIWFTESWGNKIGRITPEGTITEFTVPTPNSVLTEITKGYDGNIWFLEAGAKKIGRITSEGIITEFPLSPDTNSPGDITSSPDGNTWFTEPAGNKIKRITPSGVITEFLLPSGGGPQGITSDSSGNIWFTEVGGNKIGRITSQGVITEFPIRTDASYPYGITSGSDGNVWFVEYYTDKVGRITTEGTITEFLIPTAESYANSITSGPDGNIWFTEAATNKIGKVNLADLNDPGPPDRNALLSPFNHGVTWTVYNGYLDNRDQSKDGCGVGTNALDHCRNQLFGLDLVPDQHSDTQILAPGNGTVAYKGKLEGGCIGLRITLDNGLNLNVCHFASWNVDVGSRVLRGNILGTRSTSHIHLSLDDRYRIGTLCPGPDRCFLPIPFDGQHTIEGMSLGPDQNGETVTLPYPLCDKRSIICQFNVGFQQYKGLQGISSNIALP